MAIINCPECGNQISDKATSCPNCGFPIDEYIAGDGIANRKNTIGEENIENVSQVLGDFCDNAEEKENVREIISLKESGSQREPNYSGEFEKDNHKNDEKWCPNCGYKVESTAGICPQCGCAIGDYYSDAEKNADENVADNANEVFADIYCDMPDINMVNIDSLHLMNRNETIDVLNDVRKLTELMNYLLGKVYEIESYIDMVKEQAELMRKRRPSWELPVAVVVYLSTFILGIIGFVTLGLTIGMACILVGVIVVKVIINNKIIKDNENEANKYLNEKIPMANSILSKRQNILNEYMMTDQVQWGIDVVGEEAFDEQAVLELIGYLKSHRADSLKEALNKYDLLNHEKRMEEMQHSIDVSSQIAAQEAIIQTDEMYKQTNEMMKQTNYAQQTAKNTKKIYKKM